jgi:hypothetical protein
MLFAISRQLPHHASSDKSLDVASISRQLPHLNISSDKSLDVASTRLEKQDKLKLVALQPRLTERSAVLEEASGGQSSEVFKPLLSPGRSLVATSARLEQQVTLKLVLIIPDRLNGDERC